MEQTDWMPPIGQMRKLNAIHRMAPIWKHFHLSKAHSRAVLITRQGYAVVASLFGPNKEKGAPLYILEGNNLVSTVMLKEELGVETFQHLHGAVIRKIDGKFYIIVQSWNPGDIVILEQVM